MLTNVTFQQEECKIYRNKELQIKNDIKKNDIKKLNFWSWRDSSVSKEFV